MNFDPSAFDSEHIPKHDLILDITENAHLLINALRIQRDSDIERCILMVDTASDTFDLPDFITRAVAADTRIENIAIDSEVNRLTDQAELQIRVEAEGAQSVLIGITTPHAEGGEPTTSLIINETEMPCLEPVSNVELNRFLASLFIKNKLGDYSAFDAMNLRDATTTHRLVEALKEVAAETIVDETYFLGNTLSPNTDSVRSIEHNGTIHSATVCIEHHAQASAVEIGFTGSMMPREFDEETDNPEFLMQEIEGIRTFKQDIDGEATRIDSSNDLLIVVRDFLRAKRAAVFTPSAELLGHNDYEIADPSLEINIEDSREIDS